MKYLIVNPNGRFHRLQAIEPPLWAGLIASHLRNKGHQVRIIDAEALNIDDTIVLDMGIVNKPDCVLIVVMGNNPSVSSTPKMPKAESLATLFLHEYVTVLLAGLHPSAMQGWDGSHSVIPQQFSDTPMQPWDLLPMDLYRAHNWHCLDGSPRSPYASIYTSLGCPYDCYYCNIHALYGNHQVRFRPVEDVLKEVKILTSRYKVRNIKIWDELFTLREDRVMSICSSLRDYDLNIWAYARLDSVNPKMLKAMKEGGIKWLAYGFESKQDKKFVEQTERVIDWTWDAGINIMGNFMFGLPGETEEDWRASLEFAKVHLFEFVNFYEAKPYPGSQWYEDTKPNLKWEEYSQYTDKKSFKDYAFQEYFNNPAYLRMIENKFGQPGLNVIKEMITC